jgi:hypothetical protein
MIFIIVDRESKLSASTIQIDSNHTHFKIIGEFDEIDNPIGLACLANQLAARELFGASEEKPIKYLGERYDYYEFGIKIPDFDLEIANIDDRLQGVFRKLAVMISDYNKKTERRIKGVVYDIEEPFIPEEHFLKNINAVIGIFQDSGL